MTELAALIWVEVRKAQRSRMPLFTALGASFLPLGIAFLIFVATHPDVSAQLGLVGAKANLLAYNQTSWRSYLVLLSQSVAAGGYFVFCFVISWVFGREFADGTIKDLLAVPVGRPMILLAKFFVAGAWSIALGAGMLGIGLLAGALMGLSQGSTAALLTGAAAVAITACLTLTVVTPFAFFASIGRGYLLPLGLAILLLVAANLLAMLGLAPFFPWAVPGLYAQGQGSLTELSFALVLLTGLAGLLATCLWWQYADQTR